MTSRTATAESPTSDHDTSPFDRSALQGTSATATISLGLMEVCEDNDADCVERGSQNAVCTSPASAEDALLQVVATILQLLESGKESDLFRSCASFVKSAQSQA